MNILSISTCISRQKWICAAEFHERENWDSLNGLALYCLSRFFFKWQGQHNSVLFHYKPSWCHVFVSQIVISLFSSSWVAFFRVTLFTMLKLLLAGGFYPDTQAFVKESCMRCPNGTFVPYDKAPGVKARDCIACPQGNKWVENWYLQTSHFLEMQYSGFLWP